MQQELLNTMQSFYASANVYSHRVTFTDAAISATRPLIGSGTSARNSEIGRRLADKHRCNIHTNMRRNHVLAGQFQAGLYEHVSISEVGLRCSLALAVVHPSPPNTACSLLLISILNHHDVLQTQLLKELLEKLAIHAAHHQSSSRSSRRCPP